ncbi:hemerythrin domain-containing protein [Saccharopolyspora flava]|uniref:Hemerythrin HHE cation binding domain-containing protein n=1 Tax=Saccharopolyspora flava TaxID=95161 RepID=A0A1I6SAF5_9PSEU|nr:hemerythrin domain-containing protein [Saccharopolyspora flava]SFS73884.1 Hemerythrin HHE cation binding domain-containing protein [Saccharopolyspora flava]
MSDDVVELILADHRRFEDLLRTLRSTEGDRSTALGDLAAVLVAHAEAEESEVYPVLRKLSADDAEDVDHGAEEHAEGHEALLALMECGELEGDEWSARLEELSESLTHHLDEEERTVLNDAREEVSPERRAELGRTFTAKRRELLDADCGRLDKVRALVRSKGPSQHHH